jgi:hypothetical protein
VAEINFQAANSYVFQQVIIQSRKRTTDGWRFPPAAKRSNDGPQYLEQHPLHRSERPFCG